MSEHPNVNIFKRLYDAFTTGDRVKVGEQFADDLAWHVPPVKPVKPVPSR
jgi:ketosteroid isomerase-like protein